MGTFILATDFSDLKRLNPNWWLHIREGFSASFLDAPKLQTRYRRLVTNEQACVVSEAIYSPLLGTRGYSSSVVTQGLRGIQK